MRDPTAAGVATPVLFGSASFIFLNFSLPLFARELGADAVQIGAMSTTFTFTMLIVRPLVGWALDRFGRRVFFIAAFGFYAVAMWVFASRGDAVTLVDFYVGRFLQGIGASLMWVSARTIINDLSADNERGHELGRLQQRSMQGSMLGAFYGFTLVGMMPMVEAWSVAFVGYAVAALVGLAFSLRIRETAAAERTRGPLRLDRNVRTLLAVFFMTGFATALVEPIYLIYLKDKFDLPATTIAAAFFPAGIVFALLPRHAGRFADRRGRAVAGAVGLLAAAVVIASLPWLPGLGWIALGYTLHAAGWAFASPAQAALLGDLTNKDDRGRVIGYGEAATGLGASIGPLIGGYLYENANVAVAFAVDGAILAVAGIVVGTAFRGR